MKHRPALISEMLRLWMAANCISTRDFEKITSIPPSTTSRICNGKAVDSDTLLKLQYFVFFPNAKESVLDFLMKKEAGRG